jgi:hypothetical protein
MLLPLNHSPLPPTSAAHLPKLHEFTVEKKQKVKELRAEQLSHHHIILSI